MTNARDFSTRPVLAASLAVVREGRILLARRTAPPYDAVFSLPGGGVESGETLETAALRELHEETGVVAEVIGFLDHVEIIEPAPDGRVHRHFVIACFAGRWVSGEGALGPEASEIVWATLAEATGLRLTPGLAAMLPRALRLVEDAT